MSKKDKVPALIFLVIGLGALVTMSQLPFGSIRSPDTAFFPIILSILLTLLSLILLGQSLMAKFTEQSWFSRIRWKNLIPTLPGLVAYALLLKPVGYIVCTILIIILFAKLEKCSWKATLLVSFPCALISYAVFRWYLKSPLPQGIVPF